MLGCSGGICYHLRGENYRYLNQLNSREKYFERIIPLEHRRFMMQYEAKEKVNYILRDISQFNGI